MNPIAQPIPRPPDGVVACGISRPTSFNRPTLPAWRFAVAVNS